MAAIANESQKYSTGMKSLDGTLKGGLRPGILVSVAGQAVSSSQPLVYNLAGGIHTHYVSFGRTKKEIEEYIDAATEENQTNLTVYTYSKSELTELDDLVQIIKDFQGSHQDGAKNRYVIDPVNLIESASEYQEFLRTFKSYIQETRSLGVLHAIETGTGTMDSDGRFFTKYLSDTVFSIDHQTDGKSVNDFLVIDKLDPLQEIKEEDTRRFQLPVGLNIEVDTKMEWSV